MSGTGAVQRVYNKGMANPPKRVPENLSGDFFVDSTCINCDACRQIAPATFGEAEETSFVKAQPASTTDRRQALRALLACPTGSIGCLGDDDVKAVMPDFPLLVEESVFYCGYNSPKSFGGNSYFIRHEAGNWLIDSPKFVRPLVRRLEELGGIRHIFPYPSRRRGRCGALRSPFPESVHHSSAGIVVPAGGGGRARRRGAVGTGAWLPGHRNARPHAGALCSAGPESLSFHGRSSGLGPG
jgi:ferredoxin